MAELAAKKEAVVRESISKTDALKMFGDRGETYKCELISELEDGHITTYTQGAFTDLCRGPHLMTTAPIKAIKLTSVAGTDRLSDSGNIRDKKHSDKQNRKKGRNTKVAEWSICRICGG